jgi:hypothetical protein
LRKKNIFVKNKNKILFYALYPPSPETLLNDILTKGFLWISFALLFLLNLPLPHVVIWIKFKGVYLNVLEFHYDGKTHVAKTIIAYNR